MLAFPVRNMSYLLTIDSQTAARRTHWHDKFQRRSWCGQVWLFITNYLVSTLYKKLLESTRLQYPIGGMPSELTDRVKNA